MSLKINSTPEFERQLKVLSKKHKSIVSDVEQLINSLYENPQLGNDLGHGIFKIRLAITSKSKGKSAGARVIT